MNLFQVFFPILIDGFLVGCQRLEIIPIWQAKFPKLIVEGSTRMLYINDDKVLDVVFGFGTGADGYDIPDYVCDIYFEGQKPCLGGVMALDGKTGVEIWRLWTKHEIFALTCQADLNGDGYVDCLAGGRAGVFMAINIKDGTELWSFGETAIQSDLLSMYSAQIVEDLDSDGIQDVLAVHGGDDLSDPNPADHMYGRLILFSGRTGRLLQWMPTPDHRVSYYPPQLTVTPDGRETVIFGTGSNQHSGALYAIALIDLYRKNITNVKLIYKDEDQGMINPAALVDINNDGIQDIILASLHEKILAFDGGSFENIWNVSMDNHQSASSIAIGYYDNDNVPDVMVKYDYGNEFLVFEYEKTVVLSGQNGSVISKPIMNSLNAQSTPITISMEGYGNDIFLHWSINCREHQGEKLDYAFRSSTHMYEKSQADICQSLFGTSQDAKYLAMSRAFENGIPIYNSTDWESFEHMDVLNTSDLAQKYLADNPEIQAKLEEEDNDEDKYSVLPYKKKDFENYLKQFQEERDREFNNKLPVIDPETFAFNENMFDDNYDAENDSEDESIGVPIFREGDQDRLNVPEKRPVLYPDPSYGGYQPPQYPLYPQKLRSFHRRKRAAGQTYQGIHKQSATATLAPSLIPANDTIDVIFPTYWVYPPKLDILHQEDMKCVERELRKLQDKNDPKKDDLSVEVENIETKCLKKSGHLAKDNLIYETPSDYDPLSINMGQMMVYRFSIRCICDKV